MTKAAQHLFHAACVACLTTSAQALPSQDGVLQFEIYYYDEGDDVSTIFASVLGDTTYQLTPDFGLQLGIGMTSQLSASQDFLEENATYSVAVHGFHEASSSLRAGVLLAADSYGGGDYSVAVEGIYADGPFQAEGRFGQIASDAGTASLVEAQTRYAVTPAFGATAKYQRVSYDTAGAFGLASIGATYAFTDTVTGYASYGGTTADFGGSEIYNGNQLTLGITVAVGSTQDAKLFNYNPFF